jgi:hypothetical protein
VTRPLSEFGRNKALPDGRAFYCKPCARERSNAFYRKKREDAGFVLREKDSSPEGYKRCSHCREVKSVEEFHRHATQAGGYNTYCKQCRNQKASDLHIKRKYGLTREELDALVEVQAGLCAICETNSAVHVDHDPLSGNVRGVLCFTCNVALGQLKDDVALFRKAIDYLERTTWQRTLVAPGVYRLTSPRPAAAASSSFSLPPRPSSSRRG